MENFKHAFDIESYVYYTQIMQAETLASAYRLWRREWRGPNKEYVGGALVWQARHSPDIIARGNELTHK
jgi:beta-mannosidase